MIIQFNEDKQLARMNDLHAQEEEDLAKVLSTKYGVEYVDLTRVAIDTDALRILKEEDARRTEIAPFRKIGKKLFVAYRAPDRDDAKLMTKDIEKLGYNVRRFMVSTASLQHAWSHYKDISFAEASEEGILTISQDEIERMRTTLKSIGDVQANVDAAINTKKTHRISRVFEVILGGALALNASDVHIEPEEEAVRVRLRLDGVLTDLLRFDHATFKLIVSRIKLLSGMKLNVTTIAQDGRFSAKILDNTFDFRVSTTVSPAGENMVFLVYLHFDYS